MLGQGFEPRSSARKANMIGRTTPTERAICSRELRVKSLSLSPSTRSAQTAICLFGVYTAAGPELLGVMERTQTILLGTVLVLAAGVLGVVALGTVGADTSDQQLPNETNSTIHVSGSGSATAAPDQGVVRVTLSAEGDDIEALTDELATEAEALRDALDADGIDYETTNYGVSEPYYHDDDREYTYEATHSFELTTDDEAVGTAIDTAASVGAQVDSVRLTLTDETEQQLEDEALEAAMADARDQAETVADTESLTVSHAVDVDATQHTGYSPIRYDAATAAEGATADAPPTEINVDAVDVSHQVSVTYRATG